MAASTSASTQQAVPSSLLWTHILQRPRPPTAPPPRADLTPADKAKAATRILLHDTQSRLETFSKTADSLLNETKRARVEVERVREECAGAGEKVADEVIGAVNRSQGVLSKAIGEPAQAKSVETLAANVASLGKLIDAQTHILTALQTSIGLIVEQQSRAQDRHAQTLAALAPLLTLPGAIDALSLRVDRIGSHHSSSPRSTTSSGPSSSSVGARSSSSPKRAHDLVEVTVESPVKRRKLDGAPAARTSSNASSTTRRDVDAIFPLPASAQRVHSRHSSVTSFRAQKSSASSTSAHQPTTVTSAHARTSSSASAHTHTGPSTTMLPTSVVFETPRRDRATALQPPSSAMRVPGSAIRIPGSATRPSPSMALKPASSSKPPRAGTFLAPSSPPQPRASSPLAHTVQHALTSLVVSKPTAPPQRNILPTTRVTPRRTLAGPGIAPTVPPPASRLNVKVASAGKLPENAMPNPSATAPLPSVLPRPPTFATGTHQLALTTALQDTSDVESNLFPTTSSHPSGMTEEDADEPLMLIGSPVRPQDGRRWIDVGDSEDEDEEG